MRVNRSEVDHARTAFWSGIVLGIGGAIAAALLAPVLADDEIMRLGLVIVFFTCLARRHGA